MTVSAVILEIVHMATCFFIADAEGLRKRIKLEAKVLS